MGSGWRFVWLVLYYPVSALFRVTYRHPERIPQQGPVIVVTNHVSHIDPFLIAKFILDAARTPRFLAKESIFDVPAVGWAMRKMGHIPVKRGTADARQSLAAAVAALERGWVIVLHPEGTVTRDPDGWPMIGKTGAARLAALAPDVPVIPVAQWGVQSQFDLYKKKVKLIPRPRHVLSVGEPIDLSAFRGREPTAAMLHEMTDVIMRRLRSDVADLRGLPAPTGELYYWVRPSEKQAS
jgi:1-acyl-sn-glycerol-3-phosphate acyltransferase